ncbi:cell division protein FtsL [Streptomyces sp. BE20]|uniref:cell division protein FtsL n=1 Tax=Streptomycetaceae TaxID=2062 RepID=UPI002E769886|nr:MULTISPECIES: cell division protein FtsL [unclassified Streptomyces]MED7954078.1 cell division protein FtsL [Streptomyces sp. BE303]MEE1825969.1 cell division protein FtsL [Streptomyces sp. BE20]
MLPGQGGRARITVRPGRRQVRGRTPFAVLVVVLLGAGLLGLLALNTALNEGSFELSRLQRQTTVLTDEQQGLQHQIDQNSAPDALARRAAELGMVPAGGMAFLDLPNGGAVVGTPKPAQDSPPVKRSTVEPWPGKQPAPSAQPGAQPGSPAAAQPTTAAPNAPAPGGDVTVQLNPTAPQPAPATGGGAAR